MADEAPSQDEAPEIIAKPPSHPVTTTLLGVSLAGSLICIGFAWSELFGSYMPSQTEKLMDKHKASAEVKQPMPPGGRDHYAEDYPGTDALWYQVGKDLGVTGQGANN